MNIHLRACIQCVRYRHNSPFFADAAGNSVTLTLHHISIWYWLTVVKVVLNRRRSCGVHGERGARAYSGDLGAEPPVGSRGKAPHQGVRGPCPEAGGILISNAKNKIETENKSQMEK